MPITSNTNLSIKCRIKAAVILKYKNAVFIWHSIVTEYMNKVFRSLKNESTCDILYLNWYNYRINTKHFLAINYS